MQELKALPCFCCGEWPQLRKYKFGNMGRSLYTLECSCNKGKEVLYTNKVDMFNEWNLNFLLRIELKHERKLRKLAMTDTCEVTNKQRHEVAQRLRSLDDTVKDQIKARMARLSNEELATSLVTELGLCIALAECGFDTETSGDFWQLLANLIDRPTCHLVTDTEERVSCSNCGCSALYMADASFCPDCGSKIIEED